MNLTLIDDLILLSLDDESGSFIPNSLGFGYALAGAVLMELSLQELIVIKDKKVEVKASGRANDELLNHYLDIMRQSKKVRKVDHWIDKIGGKESDIIKSCTDKLIRQGVLKMEKKKILWVFTSTKYPAMDSRHENQVRRRLNSIVERGSEAELSELMLISLVDACELNVEVYGKEKAKRYKKQIKTIIESSKTNSMINTTVKEVHDAIMASLVIMLTTTTIITTS